MCVGDAQDAQDDAVRALASRRIFFFCDVSLLEPYHKNQIAGRRSPTPPPLLDLWPNEYEIESIKASQLVKGQVLYLCHWKGYSNDHRTWEPYENLMNGAEETVRDFHLNNPGQERDSRVEV